MRTALLILAVALLFFAVGAWYGSNNRNCLTSEIPYNGMPVVYCR